MELNTSVKNPSAFNFIVRIQAFSFKYFISTTTQVARVVRVTAYNELAYESTI